VGQRFLHEDNAGLSCGWCGCCLRGQPGIDAGSKASSCAVVGDGLPVGKVDSAVDDGGAARSNIFVTDRALTNSMARPVTKRADFRMGAKAVV